MLSKPCDVIGRENGVGGARGDAARVYYAPLVCITSYLFHRNSGPGLDVMVGDEDSDKKSPPVLPLRRGDEVPPPPLCTAGGCLQWYIATSRAQADRPHSVSSFTKSLNVQAYLYLRHTLLLILYSTNPHVPVFPCTVHRFCWCCAGCTHVPPPKHHGVRQEK